VYLNEDASERNATPFKEVRQGIPRLASRYTDTTETPGGRSHDATSVTPGRWLTKQNYSGDANCSVHRTRPLFSSSAMICARSFSSGVASRRLVGSGLLLAAGLF